MKKLNLLSRAEMKNVMGGYVQAGKCGTNECTTDAGCANDKTATQNVKNMTALKIIQKFFIVYNQIPNI